MTYISPWLRRCDCHCVLHHGHQRTNYNEDNCGCAITCVTQPMTLLAEPWNCALFLDHGGDLWYVNQLPGGQWDWSTADHAHEHHDLHDSSLIVEHHLRRAAAVLRSPTGLRRPDPA